MRAKAYFLLLIFKGKKQNKCPGEMPFCCVM